MKKIIIAILVTILCAVFVFVLNSMFSERFVKPNEFYQTSYDFKDATNVSLTQNSCLDLLAQLKNGEYDEFKTNFIDCYKTVFDKDCCYLIIRRVFVNNTSLSSTERNVLLDVLNELVEIDKQSKDDASITKNYALQQEILYNSGRVISAYNIEKNYK